jgi:hypothetical protein
MADLPLGGSAWKVKNGDLTAAFVLAVSAQKKISRSIWSGLGRIHMSIFAVGRNCTEEQNATLLSETSDLTEYLLTRVHYSTTRKTHSHLQS